MSIKNYFVFNKKITLFTAKKNKNKHKSRYFLYQAMARFLKKNKSKHISSPTSNSSSNCSWLLLFLFLRNYIWWFPNGKIFSFVSVLTLFHH